MRTILSAVLRAAPVLALLAALPAAAQSADSVAPAWRGVMVGGGYGATYSENMSGPGWHGQAHVTFARTPGRGPLRGRAEAWAMGQRGTASGSPFACTRVRQIYCFGRSDRSTLAGAGLSLAVERAYLLGRLHLYARTGAGVYHQRLRSTETEGPTTICVVEREVISCPDNPPFRSDVVFRRGTGLGVNVGFGVRARVAGVGLFADFATHAASLDGGSAGAAPLTLGFSL